MGTTRLSSSKSDEAKAIYKQRASTIETANADLKAHRGLKQFGVRGMAKIKTVAVWSALAYGSTERSPKST